MHKIVGIIIIVIMVSFLGFVYFPRKQTGPQTSLSTDGTLQETPETSVTPITDIQASFAIFTNSTFRIFTAAMYHNLSQDVYIEASNPNKVYVKQAGVTWQDFFSTMSLKLSLECLTTGTQQTFCTGSKGTLKFYLNGEKNNNALSQEIKNGDKLLVTFGFESEETIKQQHNRIP
jgi:hypothetical protein